MSIREVKCRDCDKVLYEIDGKYATNRKGETMNFLQRWEDQQGTITHWDKCEIGKAKYEAKKAQDKLNNIIQKTGQQTPAQTQTIASAELAKTNTQRNGITPTPEQAAEAKRKAEEYISKFGIDNTTKAEALTTPTVKQIISTEQLNAQQMQRIENKLDAIIKHLNIQYQEHKGDLTEIE